MAKAETAKEKMEVRNRIFTRLYDDGFKIVWRRDSEQWAADHIAYLECLWCGVLVWNDRLHRQHCTGPIVGDEEPPPPPPLT